MLVFPTRDGSFWEYESLGLVGSLGHKIADGHLQLYCLDNMAGETFYCWWRHPAERVRRHIAFEEYILNEVFPLMAMKNPHPCTIAHGCSLGAFQAANLAYRHPHLFRKLVAFSGRYDLTYGVECFGDLFGGYYDENIYYHMPTHFLPSLSCDWRLHHLRQMDIVMVIGNEDPFLDNNRHLSHLLHQKGVGHALHVWDGRAHRGHYWRQMAQIYV